MSNAVTERVEDKQPKVLARWLELGLIEIVPAKYRFTDEKDKKGWVLGDVLRGPHHPAYKEAVEILGENEVSWLTNRLKYLEVDVIDPSNPDHILFMKLITGEPITGDEVIRLHSKLMTCPKTTTPV